MRSDMTQERASRGRNWLVAALIGAGAVLGAGACVDEEPGEGGGVEENVPLPPDDGNPDADDTGREGDRPGVGGDSEEGDQPDQQLGG